MKGLAQRISVFISLIWLGMILGISFLEAPVKFTAPSVTLPVGLDIGRHVFAVFNKVEIVWALAVLMLFLIMRPGLKPGLFLMVVGTVLAVQSAWLLPLLDQRAALIIKGEVPPASFHHSFYVILEIVKAAALGVYGFLSLFRREQGHD